MSFREMKDYELAGLPDEELIAYVVRARKAGALDAARTGLGVFCHRRWDDLVARALVKMPSKSDAEDVAAQTVRDVFRAAFDGQSVGEAVRFMQRVLARRIADWYEARKQTEALPEDAGDDEEWHGYDAAITPDETGGVDAADAVERVYERLSSSHQEVVDDFGFAGYGAKETAERVNKSFPDLDTPMSEQNVHKIASRFRQDLRGELGLE